MRYRPLDALGDYTIGKPFLVNSPQCVAQAIATRLKLWKGEWFVNTADGTPYNEEVLGKRQTRNPAIVVKQRILATPGVNAITAFEASFDGTTRQLTITATVDTIYGAATISEVL